jgi:hypothetical protein
MKRNLTTRVSLLTVSRLFAFFQVLILFFGWSIFASSNGCTLILDFDCPPDVGTTDPGFSGQTQWADEDIVLTISAFENDAELCETKVHTITGFAYNNDQAALWDRLVLIGKVKKIGEAESDVRLYAVGGGDSFVVLVDVIFERTGDVLAFDLKYNRDEPQEEHYELERQP